jgi:anti-anti-sigma factor
MKAPAPKVEQAGNVRVITFTGSRPLGRGDVLSTELEGRTDGLEGAHLLLDFTNVEHVNSAELGALIGLNKQMTQSGGRLTLFNLTAEVYEVFTVTRLHTLFAICTRWPPGVALLPRE